MTARAWEVNFDGLVGPTHNYAGLSYGNIASQEHKLTISQPKAAALQGLAKMKLLTDLGLKQAVLPPQERPDLSLLRRAGIAGPDADVLQQARRKAPQLLAACASASSMWAANAATVSPSADTADRRVHFTAANLANELHRSIETAATTAILSRIFADPASFAHHDPLPAAAPLRDEGAANHTRLCDRYNEPALELFVYGVKATDTTPHHRYPTRHTFEASAAVARLHRLDPGRTIFIQQHPDAIDAGAFHNDVVAVGNLDVLFYHEQAFTDSPAVIDQLRREFARTCGQELTTIEARADQLSLTEAVESYLFNSQMVRLPDQTTALICPNECCRSERTRNYIDSLVGSGSAIQSVHFVDVRQSMMNGGGPACLRLRVALNDEELGRVHPGVLLTDQLYNKLVDWVERHYRDALQPDDLADPRLLDECRSALDELSRILQLGSIYPFQSSVGGQVQTRWRSP